jgi:aspartyl-tRNA(Asn)/glutamyl-tRNA(Gln) amidotransferase subunit B
MSWQEKYEPVIGLEVHVELKTRSKMFCGCVNNPFHAEKPNMYTCPVCLGMPGGLPVPNKKAIEWTVMIGLATNCKINTFSKFDRKHYFYPDLAKGYQISQYDMPFCHDGLVNTSLGEVRLTRIHLEEDTGKLLHTTIKGKKVSLVDFNRSGVPLVEIVTEPDIKSGAHAKECGKKLRQLLRFLNVADCDMEQGGMRLEANISLRKIGEKTLPNYKVEVKNINSFRFLEQAINYELERQAKLLDEGTKPTQETRGWDSLKNQTTSQRSKEEAADYRYFPDPDIPPIHLDDVMIKQIQDSLPELPEAIGQRWQKTYSLHPKQVAILLEFDNANELQWLDLIFTSLTKQSLTISQFVNDFINKKLIVTPKIPIEQIIEKFIVLHTVEKIDDKELKSILKKVITNNPEAVKKYQTGEQQVIGFFMGQVMRELNNRKADAQALKRMLESELEA